MKMQMLIKKLINLNLTEKFYLKKQIVLILILKSLDSGSYSNIKKARKIIKLKPKNKSKA